MKRFNLVLIYVLSIMIAFLLGIYVAPSVETHFNGGTVASSSPVIEELPPSAPEVSTVEADPSNSQEVADDDSGADESENLTEENSISGQGVGEPIEFRYSMNSADAIKLTWEAENLTGKTINYYTAHISTFNPVGDPSMDQLNGKSNFSVKYVGPVEPNDTILIFSDFTYQSTLDKIVIDQLTLQYDDGTIETIDYGYETTDDSGL